MYDESGNLIPEDPWSSIVDLMSALVLVLFLAVIFFVSNYSEVTTALDVERSALKVKSDELKSAQSEMLTLNLNLNDLKRREEALSVKASQLSDDKQALLGDKARLIAERDVLSADRDALTKASAALLADKDKLTAERDLLAEQKRLVDQERAQLLAQKERLERDQRALLGDKSRLLDDQERLKSRNDDLDAQVASLSSELKELQERQSKVMTSLSDAFKKAKAQGVSVDQEGGKITMKSEVLFGVGEALLSEQGRRELDAVSRGLSGVLNDPSYKGLIEGVMIEGHTSSEGKSVENRGLSAERALAALNYLLERPGDREVRARYERLFFAGAFGESRPVLDAQGRELPDQSRRIEIRILFNQTDTQRLTHDLTQLK
jgi:outer membrane protein OmpA-like peptidoglycan-associated protein